MSLMVCSIFLVLIHSLWRVLVNLVQHWQSVVETIHLSLTAWVRYQESAVVWVLMCWTWWPSGSQMHRLATEGFLLAVQWCRFFNYQYWEAMWWSVFLVFVDLLPRWLWFELALAHRNQQGILCCDSVGWRFTHCFYSLFGFLWKFVNAKTSVMKLSPLAMNYTQLVGLVISLVMVWF